MTEVAAWILYSIVIANLLGLAAMAGESALRDGGKPGRWAWVASMVASIALPLLAWLGLSLRSVPVVPESALIPLAPLATVPLAAGAGGAAGDGPGIDRILLILWLGVTAVVLIYMLLSWAAIVRDRRHWRMASVGGVRVALTPDIGPAAWGVRHPQILLPEWAIELESRVRRLMLLHEGEHVRAGDTRVVLVGLLLLAVAPWNLPLWWQLRRLRQAIELDCDSRVLRRAPDARRYGSLLLEVGRRRSTSVMVVALADPPSFLERRIRLITARARIPSLRRVAGLALVAGSLVVLAVCTRDPMAVDDASVEAVSAEAAAGPTFTPFTVPPRLLNVSEVQTLLEQRYPSDLRASGVGGTVDMSFFLEDDGSILSLQVRDGSGVEALDRAAVEIASAMRFTPAMNRDEAVRVWISLPVTFRSEAPTATEPVKPNGDPLEQAVDSSDEAVESAGDPEPASVESAAGGAAELDANPARLRDRIDSFPAGDAIDAETRTERMRQVLDESPDITLTRTTVHGPTSVSGADFQTAAAAVERASDGGTVLSGMDQPEADSEQPSRSPFTARPELQNLAEIQTLIEQEYPPLLRDAGIGGRADVLMLIDSNGNIVRTQLAEGTGQPALDEAALRVAAASRFTPARNEGEATTVWVSLPIAFVSR